MHIHTWASSLATDRASVSRYTTRRKCYRKTAGQHTQLLEMRGAISHVDSNYGGSRKGDIES